MDETTGEGLSPASRTRGVMRRAYAYARKYLHAYSYELVIFVLIAAVGLIFMMPLIYHTIPAGHVGVLWKRFGGGTVTDAVYPEGYRLTFPWDILYIYDARLQMVEREVQVLSSDGLQITLDLVWRYHLLRNATAQLHKFVGPDYAETLIAPTVGARARDVLAVYHPEEIYTESRLKIQNQILESVRFDLYDKFNPPDQKIAWLGIEDVLIKGMTLPQGVQDAIVRKNEAFHQIEEYAFRVQKEQKEAERKRIEAVGIRNFQEIVSNGMSESYLRWRGIEATLDLAKSQNAKVVVIGNSKNGLPLILNMDNGKESILGPTTGAAKPAPKARERQAPRSEAPPSGGSSPEKAAQASPVPREEPKKSAATAIGGMASSPPMAQTGR